MNPAGGPAGAVVAREGCGAPRTRDARHPHGSPLPVPPLENGRNGAPTAALAPAAAHGRPARRAAGTAVWGYFLKGPMTCGDCGYLLRTLGHPVLTGPRGRPVGGLRRKDLALLAYLCVEGPRPHSRARLAALLWGESPERNARHSLTQALRRIREAAGEGALEVEREQVRATGAVPCDAAWLLEEDARLDPLLSLYEGDFLEGFELPFGSEEFGQWADGQRAKLRNAALRRLDRAGGAAEEAGDWALALRIGERAAKIDPVHEEAHRRVLRALIESGERNRALRYYQEFARWLAEEVGAEPDPETAALAGRAGASAPAPAPPPAPPAPPPCPPPPPPEPAEPAPAYAVADVDEEADDWTPAPPPAHPPAPAEAGARSHCAGWALVAGAIIVVLVRAVLAGLLGAQPAPPPAPPGDGESIRAAAGGPVYLAYAGRLWRYPDAATLDRCLGGWRHRVRRVRALPDWPRRTLHAVATYPWQGGADPVVADDPLAPTQHVAVGCVLAPIPDPRTFRAIFGHTEWSRSRPEDDSVLRASPRTPEAGAFPLRLAGTLLRSPGGEMKWVVYHGGALAVSPRALASYCRRAEEAVAVTAAEFAYYRAPAALPPAGAPCR